MLIASAEGYQPQASTVVVGAMVVAADMRGDVLAA